MPPDLAAPLASVAALAAILALLVLLRAGRDTQRLRILAEQNLAGMQSLRGALDIEAPAPVQAPALKAQPASLDTLTPEDRHAPWRGPASRI